jgi:hypothetical protein
VIASISSQTKAAALSLPGVAVQPLTGELAEASIYHNVTSGVALR